MHTLGNPTAQNMAGPGKKTQFFLRYRNMIHHFAMKTDDREAVAVVAEAPG